jgi:hypothetical protein
MGVNMIVEAYEPRDVFIFWCEIQRDNLGYDFDYVTNIKRDMLHFMIYVYRTENFKEEYRDELYEHFIKNVRKIDSFHVPVFDNQILSTLYHDEISNCVYEVIECEYSVIPVERNVNVLLGVPPTK